MNSASSNVIPYHVGVHGSHAVLIGDNGTQVNYLNYFYNGTWTDGVEASPLVNSAGVIRAPYRGLGAFTERDAALFHGRERAVIEVLKLLSDRLSGSSLLVLSGVSGAGKSSLLQAGVVPWLRKTGLTVAPWAARWPCLVFTPTSKPIDELAVRIAGMIGATASAVRRELSGDATNFALIARAAALTGYPLAAGSELEKNRLLLIVDQCEQLFAPDCEEQDRRAFLTALYSAATARLGDDRVPAAMVVLAIRADFEARLAGYDPDEFDLLEKAVQGRYLLGSMNKAELRMAVTEPAKAAGGSVDEDLVQVLLEEMRAHYGGGGLASSAAGGGGLPLLSHVLDRAWRGRAGTNLTLADYERTGGIHAAVGVSAQNAYESLSGTRREVARQVFTLLVSTTSDGLDTAVRIPRANLVAGMNQAGIADVDAVVDAFVSERLLTVAADSVEISHEALLTAWPLLRDWLASSRSDRLVISGLATSAREWASSGSDPSFLYSGSRLDTAEKAVGRIVAGSRSVPPGQAVRDFLRASHLAARRKEGIRRATIAVLAILTLTAFTAAGISVHDARVAARQHALALSRQLAAESLIADATDPATARRLALAAWKVSPTAQAMSALSLLLTEQQQGGILPQTAGDSQVVDLHRVADAFSPDGKFLAAAGENGLVQLWDMATGHLASPPISADPRDGVNKVAFSPDGDLLATADGNGLVRFWNPVTGRPAGKPLRADSGRAGGVFGLAFSRGGKLLASAGADGLVRLWNPATGHLVGKPIRAGPGAGVNDIAFSPDGGLLAAAVGNGLVQLWTVSAAPKLVRVLHSPSYSTLNGSTSAGNVTVRISSSGKILSSRTQPAADAVAFGANGRLLASAYANGLVRMWNPVTGQQIGAPMRTGSRNGVDSLAFNPDGRLLASADDNSQVRFWDPATGRPAGPPLRAGPLNINNNTAAAFSPDGKLLATGDAKGFVRLWHSATGQPAGVPLPAGPLSTGNDTAVAFSPDGKFLATGDDNRRLRLWDPATGKPVGKPIDISDVGDSPVDGLNDVEFSPDGNLLATADATGLVRFWDPATGQPVGKPLPADDKRVGASGVTAVTFSPDGRLLASADANGLVRLWNTATGQPVGKPLRADPGNTDGGVFGVAFSPDGKLLASADANGLVQLWNPITGDLVGVPIDVATRLPEVGVYRVSFSPGGSTLVSLGGHGAIRQWNVALFAAPNRTLCDEVGAPTSTEWAKYAPGERQPKICSGQ